MRDKKNITIVVLVGIVVLLLILNIKEKEPRVLFDDTELRQTIAEQQKVINSQLLTISSISLERDTIVIIETQIKNKYHEIYVFNNTASSFELDSIIRDDLNLIASTTISDSLTCYTKDELRPITDRVVRARECDTLLILCEIDTEYADSIIASQGIIIDAKNTQLVSGEEIITGKNADIAGLQEDLFQQAKKTKWLKIGWATTSGVLVSLLLISVL